jgi:hypothetical protein
MRIPPLQVSYRPNSDRHGRVIAWRHPAFRLRELTPIASLRFKSTRAGIQRRTDDDLTYHPRPGLHGTLRDPAIAAASTLDNDRFLQLWQSAANARARFFDALTLLTPG